MFGKAWKTAISLSLMLTLGAQAGERPNRCNELFTWLLDPAQRHRIAESSSAIEARKPKKDIFSSRVFDAFEAVMKIRYRVKVTGMEDIKSRGDKGILFLFNHAAWNDPPNLMAALGRDFKIAPVMESGPVESPLNGTFKEKMGLKIARSVMDQVDAVIFPDPIKEGVSGGTRARLSVERAIEETIEKLKSGKNVLLYPSGHLTYNGYEDIGNRSMVERIVKAYPEARIVLGRSSGLWGSSLSRAKGGKDDPDAFKKAAKWALLNGVFKMPKRDVSILLHEPKDFPRTADRDTINRYLESFYNAEPIYDTYVPYHFLEKGGVRKTPVPMPGKGASAELIAGPVAIQPEERAKVITRLQEFMPSSVKIQESDSLADLGVDSLETMELAVWLEDEYKRPIPEIGKLATVRDVLEFASRGKAQEPVLTQELLPAQVSKEWVRHQGKGRLVKEPKGKTITEAFLEQARLNPDRVIAEDPINGPLTYRKMIAGIYQYRPLLEKMKGDKVGILLPSSGMAETFKMAARFAGKTPVVIDPMIGEAAIKSSLERIGGVENIITVGKFVDDAAFKGAKLGSIEKKLVFVEDLEQKVSLPAMGKATMNSYWSWKALDQARVPEQAMILVHGGASGEAMIAPLSHEKIMSNLKNTTQSLPLTDQDRIMGVFPGADPQGNLLSALSLTRGVPAVYYPNPSDEKGIAEHIAAYHPTIVLGHSQSVDSLMLVDPK